MSYYCNELAEWDVHSLHDSGERQGFPSGAVRDTSRGKGQCDLLPLGVVARFMDDEVLRYIDAYMQSGNTGYIDSALRAFMFGEDLPFSGDAETQQADWMLLVAKHFEQGADKYNERNWESGIPVHCYIDSGVRHYLKHLRGDEDEPHDVAFIWNMLCLIWTHHHRPECIDIKFKEEK